MLLSCLMERGEIYSNLIYPSKHIAQGQTSSEYVSISPYWSESYVSLNSFVDFYAKVNLY